MSDLELLTGIIDVLKDRDQALSVINERLGALEDITSRLVDPPKAHEHIRDHIMLTRYGVPKLLDKINRLEAENVRLREGIETVARRLANGQLMFQANTHDPAERYMGEMQRALTALLAGTD